MKKIPKKLIRIISIIIILICLYGLSFLLDFSKEDVKYGVTFSPFYAQNELKINWQETYLAILDDLKVDHIRLSAYWNQIESEKGTYDFTDLDWQIAEASKRDINIILAIGRRLPRWPECHDPIWLKDLSPEEIRKPQLDFISTTIYKYKNNPNIKTWQIENEPFLSTFGECPPLDHQLFKDEIRTARSISPKPILVTDSGELNLWINAARTGANIVGTTLYKVVYNKNIGYIKYPLPPLFYYSKGWFIKTFFGTEKVINAELQAEAWHTEEKNLLQMTLEEQFESLDINQFKENIILSRKSGFEEIYLWGAEWWYFLKTERGYDAFWEEAKTLW